jgi:hypothetical protein
MAERYSWLILALPISVTARRDWQEFHPLPATTFPPLVKSGIWGRGYRNE